jgi:hypothetical protein
LCHGVDFGGSRLPGDVHAIEPIYWACNADRHASALKIKSSVAIPHPFLLVAGDRVVKGDDVLVVGPPPGKANDQRLLAELRKIGATDATILVKPRLGWQGSIEFWEAHGYRAVTLGDAPTLTYQNMVELFSGYGHVIGSTLSSAIVFAAALGSDVSLLRDYRFTAFDVVGSEEMFEPGPSAAREYARCLVGPDRRMKTSASRVILGEDLDWSPSVILQSIAGAIAQLASPFHFPRTYPSLVRWLVQEAALWLDRPGLIARPLEDRLTRRPDDRVGLLEMNDVDFWLNGKTSTNYSFDPVPYIAGRTVPGNAPDPY